MGSSDCCLDACYTTVLRNARTQRLGFTHSSEVVTLWQFTHGHYLVIKTAEARILLTE
jgi:hypothetical protein